MHELPQPAHYQLTKSPTSCEQLEMCGLRMYSHLECDAIFAANSEKPVPPFLWQITINMASHPTLL